MPVFDSKLNMQADSYQRNFDEQMARLTLLRALEEKAKAASEKGVRDLKSATNKPRVTVWRFCWIRACLFAAL